MRQADSADPRTVRVPPDKSITHRALLLAGAASGESRIRNPLGGADCRATRRALRTLGVEVSRLRDGVSEVHVRGGWERWRSPSAPIDCGNSGTTARLGMGILAGRPVRATLTGDHSLRRRPMRRVIDPLTRMGADLRELEEEDRLPVEVIGGALEPAEHRSAVPSAQVKSAVLLAALGAGVEARVTEPELSRDHTERMLRALGVSVETSVTSEGTVIRMDAHDGALPSLDLSVPGDASSAAFFVGLPSLLGRDEIALPDVGNNLTRKGFLEIAGRMGVPLRIENQREEGGEPVADLVAGRGRLAGVTVVPEEVGRMIDEMPALAVLAARAEGETTVSGAAELRVKESDRITALVGNLRAIGAEAEERPDGFVVVGSDRPLRGRVTTHGDHRIAMAFGLLGAVPGNEIEIDDPDCVDVSFPGFWTVLQGVVDG